jgi:hypothetical protein
LDNVVKIHGVPQSIVCDRDTVFTSSFWTELFTLVKTELKLSSAYHPQTDGQTERVNQCLEMFLRCAVQATPNVWTKWLSLGELWYNTSYHTSLHCSPFKALYGVDPTLGLVPTLRLADHLDVASILKERQMFTELIKDQLAIAQNRMKVFADNNRTERSFQVGEQLLLKLQPNVQSSVVNMPFPKLAYKYFSPYEVLEKLGSMSYNFSCLITAQCILFFMYHS